MALVAKRQIGRELGFSVEIHSNGLTAKTIYDRFLTWFFRLGEFGFGFTSVQNSSSCSDGS
jgi:hypothetical protein